MGVAPGAATSLNTRRLITKEAINTPQPTMFTSILERKFLPNPLIRKPTSGRSGIRKTYLLISFFESDQSIVLGSVFQPVEEVDVH